MSELHKKWATEISGPLNEWKNNTPNGTKHADMCAASFGRKDLNCPRCKELIAGYAPRTWTKSNDQMRVDSIRAHFAPGGPHSQGKCDPCCTFGDY